MPIYQFKHKETGEVTEKVMKFSEREHYLNNNPQLEVMVGAPPLVYNASGKPDAGFRDVLKEIKRNHDHPRQFTRTTINTF